MEMIPFNPDKAHSGNVVYRNGERPLLYHNGGNGLFLISIRRGATDDVLNLYHDLNGRFLINRESQFDLFLLPAPEGVDHAAVHAQILLGQIIEEAEGSIEHEFENGFAHPRRHSFGEIITLAKKAIENIQKLKQ